MFKKKNAIIFIIFLIIISIISGVITYRSIVGKSNKKPALKSGFENGKDIKEEAIEKIKSHSEIKFSINDAFNGQEILNIKNNPEPSITVDLEGKNKSIVVANFKALHKRKVTDEEYTSEALDSDSYDYEIDIKDKNAKIRLYGEAGYVTAETKEDGKDIIYTYKLDKKEVKDFMKILEEIYPNELLKKILYPLPDEIYLNANDENAVYVAKNREIKNLVSKLKILSIEERENYVGVPTIYPSYDMTIKRDEYQHKFYLKNNELMIIDTPILYLYCKYDKELWDYVVDKLPQENVSKENELKFLLKSEKVVVKDFDGVYDFENHTYYNIELPRQIIRSELEKMGDSSQLIISENMRFVLWFYIDGQPKEVIIYNNYMTYEGCLYYSKNMGENIRSTLMIP